MRVVKAYFIDHETFRKPKSAKQEKSHLDSCIPRAMQYATKWPFKIFCDWQKSRDQRSNPRCSDVTDFRLSIE